MNKSSWQKVVLFQGTEDEKKVVRGLLEFGGYCRFYRSVFGKPGSSMDIPTVVWWRELTDTENAFELSHTKQYWLSC